MITSGNLLIVDDDFSFRHALRGSLSNLGFTIAQASDAERALAVLQTSQVDAVLLDVNMPGKGGLWACREIRGWSASIPILMLTVRDGKDDIVRGLEAGADDYVTKPFHLPELAARLKAAIRRVRLTEEATSVIRIGEIELDQKKRIVKKRGAAVHLTPKEFDLLEQLMLHPGMPLPHSRLLRSVWGPEYGGELEYLRTFLRQLRVKIEDDPSQPRYLLTEAFVGYRFREDQPTSTSACINSEEEENR